MFIPHKSIKQLHHQDQCCKGLFNVLSWNVAKLTLSSSYKDYIKQLIENENIDILLLQEVRKSLSDELDIHGYSYVLSPNIQTKNHLFGVLSAFKISCENNLSVLTQKKELRYMTHKVSLITEHKTSSDTKLVVVNLHAINFVKNSDFHHELEGIKAALIFYKGPMIVAGDFNTWNRKRLSYLTEFRKTLGLKEVSYEDSTHIKKVFSNCLDYIFYRDLKLIDSKVINSQKLSDHNPIIARFELSD